jgi:hypothetical protein
MAPREDVDEAIRQNRLLLAKLQVRDDALAEEMATLGAERAASAGELQAALGEKIALLEAERREIAARRDATLGELAQLGKLKGKLPVLEAQALAREALAFTGADPDAVAPATPMSEDEVRAQLAALKAQRAAPAQDDSGGGSPAGGSPSRKRTL